MHNSSDTNGPTAGKPSATSTNVAELASGSCPTHAWCAMGESSAVEHDQYHAGDPVELAGSDGSLEAGWWGWLFQDAGEQLMVTIEGHRQRGVDVAASAVAALLAASETPEGRQALTELLASAGVEV